jgi:SAM-dependent methyltransferase
MKGNKMDLPASDWFVDTEYWEINRSFIWSKKRIEMSATAAASISKLLEMRPGESILDLACGFGRYSLPLAKLGYSVTGIDLNQSFIREASEKANEMQVDAKFDCVDMRNYIKPEGFESIIIMYNSFGYFHDPDDDRKVIENCYQSLKPGGKLILHNVTREYIVANRASKQSRYWFEEDDGTIRLEETTANDDWTWGTTRWIVIKGLERREFTYGMRIYSTSEYIDLFTSSGFINPETFGGVSGGPYDKEKDHLVLVVEKPDKDSNTTA